MYRNGWWMMKHSTCGQFTVIAKNSSSRLSTLRNFLIALGFNKEWEEIWKKFFFLLSHRTYHTIATLCSAQLPYSIMLICLQKKKNIYPDSSFVCLTFWHCKSFGALKYGEKLNHYVRIIAVVCFKCTQKTLVTDFFRQL